MHAEILESTLIKTMVSVGIWQIVYIIPLFSTEVLLKSADRASLGLGRDVRQWWDVARGGRYKPLNDDKNRQHDAMSGLRRWIINRVFRSTTDTNCSIELRCISVDDVRPLANWDATTLPFHAKTRCSTARQLIQFNYSQCTYPLCSQHCTGFCE